MAIEVSKLIEEYNRSGGFNDLSYRRSRADDIRYCSWAGQDDDGKKHQRNDNEQVFPWDGAADTRVRLADAIINENVDVLVTAFQRGVLRASPTEVSDAAQAEVCTTLLKYYRNKLQAEFRKEAELCANQAQQYGFSVLHVRWDKEVTKKMEPITLDILIEIGQQAGEESAFSQLPAMIADPEQNDLAAEVLEAELGIKRRRAKKMVRELREDGQTEWAVDVVTKNCPQVLALKPFDEIFFPPETVELQSTSHVFRRVWMTEFELKELVSVYDYNEAWVDAVLNAQDAYPSVYQEPLSDTFTQSGATEGLYEVIYGYRKEIDEDGVLNVHCTVFNPKISDLRGKDTILDHCAGKFPFVVVRRENVSRKLIDTRGVCDIVHTWQLECKAQRDALTDRASLMVFPPLTVPARMGQVYRLQPGSELPEMRPGEVKFLDPPRSSPNEALNVIAYVEKQCDDYFGRLNDNTNPVMAQAKLQSQVDKYMSAWSEAFTMMFKLIQQYLGDEDLTRIAGVNPGLPTSQAEIQGEYDMSIRFDVRELDSEAVVTKLKSVIDLLPIDTAGVLDRAKLMQLAVNVIDPVLGQSVMTDQRGASQKTFDKVNQDIALMALGNEAAYTENDPTAGMKMQFMQQIIQGNPKYQEALQSDERFQALLDNYGKNLQQSIAQEQNKMIGRLGVQPVTQ